MYLFVINVKFYLKGKYFLLKVEILKPILSKKKNRIKIKAYKSETKIEEKGNEVRVLIEKRKEEHYFYLLKVIKKKFKRTQIINIMIYILLHKNLYMNHKI